MSSDFSAQGRSARALIDVPEVPIASIRAGSRASRARQRMRIAAACAALLVAVAVGAGTGAGAKVYSSVRVWLSGGKAAVTVSSFDGVREPTSAEFRNAIAHATFPVVLPTGLPDGTRVTHVFSTPAGHPSALFISYANDRTRTNFSVVLVDPAVIELGEQLVKMQGASPAAMYDWRAGREVVLMPKTLSAAEAKRIEAAMQNATPAETLAATEPMLATVIVLGDPGRLQLAERYRPQSGRSVLVPRDQLRSIGALARRGAPIRDTRVFHVTEFPYRNGVPDYSRVKGWNARTVAVPPGGVRAIDAVLRSARSTGGNGDCGCEVLFNETSPTAYAIWTIPLSGSGEVRRYTVDARTLTPVGQPL